MVHSDGVIVYANRAAASLLGADSGEELVGIRAFDLIHEDSREQVRVRMAEEEEAGPQGSMLGQRWVRLDGTTVEVEVAGKPVTFRGKAAGLVVARDISARRDAEDRLSEAERRYRALVETLPAVSYIDLMDEDQTTLYVSPQIDEVLGLSAKSYEADPKYWESRLHPDDRDETVREYEEFLRSGDDELDQEYRLISEDGRTVWCHDKTVVLEQRQDGYRMVQGIIFNITEQKLAAEGLMKKQDILEAVDLSAQSLLRAADWREAIDDVLQALGEATEVNTIGIWEVSSEPGESPTRTSLTHEWVRAGGTPLLGNPDFIGFPLGPGWSEWEADMRADRSIFGDAEGRPEGEHGFYEQAGMKAVLDVPVWVDGEWWGIIGLEDSTSRDFTAGEVEALRAAAETLGAALSRERTERALREAEQKYRALVEQIPAVLYVDRPGNEDHTIYISPAVEEILGLSAQAWVDDPLLWYQHLHPDDQQHALMTYRRGVSSGTPFSYEYRMITPRGTIWIRDDAVVLRDDEDRVLVQGVMFDITEQKLAEEALLESESREREAAEELRRLDQMKNTFLAAVSHELRSPLTSVLGLALTLEAQDLPREDALDLLRRLSSNAKRLQRLLADLLDIDRLSRGVIAPVLHTTDVGALVQVAVESIDYMGDRTVKVEADPVIAAVDTAKVERIVENLLVNVVRHTPVGTTAWVRVTDFEDGALITVEDDGPGVPPEIKEAVFDPFRQGPTHASHTPGTGIGLTLVQQFTKLHGGRAWVEDRPGGGASFKVYLPDARDGSERP